MIPASGEPEPVDLATVPPFDSPEARLDTPEDSPVFAHRRTRPAGRSSHVHAQRDPPFPRAADRRSARTATSPAASTTRSRPGSRRSRATGSSRSTRPMRTPPYRTRAIAIKEERAELVKHHLDVLWHDYFKPEHLDDGPEPARPVLAGQQAGLEGQGLDRPRGRQAPARAHRRGRRRLEGHRRAGEDARGRPAELIDLGRAGRRDDADPGGSR